MAELDEGQDYYTSKRTDLAEISKITIGKLIVRWCGNEGCDNSPEQESVRQLLQHLLSSLESESKETWQNATIELFAKYGDGYLIVSGDGENKFILHFDGKDDPRLACVQRVSTFTFKNFTIISETLFKSVHDRIINCGRSTTIQCTSDPANDNEPFVQLDPDVIPPSSDCIVGVP